MLSLPPPIQKVGLRGAEPEQFARNVVAMSRKRDISCLTPESMVDLREKPFKRRRTDGDGQPARRAGYRAIAEEAYRLYLANGADGNHALAYWELAEQHVKDPGTKSV